MTRSQSFNTLKSAVAVMRASSSLASASALARPLAIRPSITLLAWRLALVGALLVAVDQHDLDAGLRRDVTDAGAHETGADDGELLHLGRRHVRPDGARPC